ncbi:ferredoxin reductase [Nakamurella flavida]|uniref:Ferredoxin reductase n=2 Tax=Nakamurella flavida TaxID=363630 RepID=A0A939C1S6_9ACTN|nr:ferredoxin reductase [Nakamurella flavida]MBM9475770.1 ferredoxin reductase [Nakamurella flavida]MDP9777950.1 ferredoxin-NADP reductase [Nakamurella flavida]
MSSEPGAGTRASLRRRLWTVADSLASPRKAADYLDMFRPMRRGADLRARVMEVRDEVQDAVTVVLRPGVDWRGHLPGQYVRIGIDVDGIRRWRSYSITSTPAIPRSSEGEATLSVTAKAVPGGLVTNHLAQELQVGDLVHLDQACGTFVLPDPVPRKPLFITAGSGITPVVGMLRSGLDRLRDAVLLHSDRTPGDVLFGPELRGLAAAGKVRLIENHTDADGRLDMAAITELVPDLAERQTWACGPAGLLDAIEEHWAELGIAEQLHTERFRTARAEPGQGGTVRFGSGTEIAVDGSTALLDAGEQAGLLLPSGCRMGICFSCVLPLREGAVRDLRSGELTIASPGDGVLVQTCVSAAAGACQIDL